MSQAPAAPPESAPTLPEGVSPEDLAIPEELLSSLSPELRKGLSAAQDVAAPEVTDSQDVTPPADDESEPGDGLEDQETLAFVEQLVQNPLSITQVPRDKQGQVMQTLLSSVLDVANKAVETRSAAEYERGMQEGMARAKMQFGVEIANDLLEAGDTESFEAFVKEHFGSRANYLRAQEGLPLAPTGEAAAFQTRASKIVEALNPYPELIERFKQNWNYQASDDDMIRLAMDVGKAIASKESSGSASADDPAAMQELTKRREAAAHRQTLPRPPANAGSAAPANVITREMLEKAKPDQVAQWLGDPEKAKQIEAIASGQ